MKKQTMLIFSAIITVALLIAGNASSATTSTLTTTTISGVVSSSGIPLGGAIVVLRAWPNQASREAATNGTNQNMLTIGSVRTNPDGSYSLLVNLAQIPSNYLNEDGTVNLAAMAMNGSTMASTNFPLNTLSPPAAAAAGAIDMAQGATSAGVLKAYSSMTNVPTGTAILQSITPYSGVVPCGMVWYGPYGPYQAALGTSDAMTGVVGRITYAKGSSTSTTLGVAFNGGNGWSADGTATNSASTSYGFDTGYKLQNDRQYGLWDYHEEVGYGSCAGKWYEPLKYVGIGKRTTFTHVHYSYCTGKYYAGYTWNRSSSTNGGYSAGVSLPWLSVYSQAGWNTSMTVHYHFNVNGHVCGSNSAYEGAPRVEGRNY